MKSKSIFEIDFQVKIQEKEMKIDKLTIIINNTSNINISINGNKHSSASLSLDLAKTLM